MNGEAGKGSAYRPVNREKYEREYDRIFGKKEKEPERKSDERKGSGGTVSEVR